MSSRNIYRRTVDPGNLVSFTVVSGQTDLLIRATRDVHREALDSVARHRHTVQTYLSTHPRFATSLQPVDVADKAPDIVRTMADAGLNAGIGPMSAVAGAIAEAVGRDLLAHCAEVIVENGGDLFISTHTARTVALYAGSSPLSGRVGISVGPDQTVGVCTSTGTFGHSLSFGRAHACVVTAFSTALADAVATAMCNRVRRNDDLSTAVEMATDIKNVTGAVAVLHEHMAVQGDVTLVRIASTP